jgi:hypothetical protein
MSPHNPYLRDGFTWLRGNLHAHTTLSDGSLPPEEVIAAYERLGYDFLAISDHDLLVPPRDYQARTKMVLVPADEVTRDGPHILSVNLRELVAPDADRQRVIDDASTQGGFTVLNHPNWQEHFNHFPQELMERLTGYLGIEIYNGVIERLEGSALATDRWDRLLASGRRVWGFAHDDSHAVGDIGRGWNVVQAADRSVEAICEAIRHGRFYASTGVEITRIEEENGVLSITAPNAQRIRFLGAFGRELYYVDDSQASYRVTGDEGAYLRAECYGEGIRAAWTQPFFLSAPSPEVAP